MPRYLTPTTALQWLYCCDVASYLIGTTSSAVELNYTNRGFNYAFTATRLHISLGREWWVVQQLCECNCATWFGFAATFAPKQDEKRFFPFVRFLKRVREKRVVHNHVSPPVRKQWTGLTSAGWSFVKSYVRFLPNYVEIIRGYSQTNMTYTLLHIHDE
jgi:hypothetical protein